MIETRKTKGSSLRNTVSLPASRRSSTVGPATKEYETIDDASITSQVKYALLTHRSTSAIKTKITTTDGAVVITGEAANDAEKSLVGKLATSVRGVKSVDSNMTVKI